MIRITSSSIFYNELNKLVAINNDEATLDYIEINKSFFDNYDDLALICLNCGFLNYKLGRYSTSIEYFSEAIEYENKIDCFSLRSKDISYSGRCNSKYKSDDFKGAIYDKREARRIRLLEANNCLNSSIFLDYKKISQDSIDISKIEMKYIPLIKNSKITKNKYDLIDDFKKVINDKRKKEIISKL